MKDLALRSGEQPVVLVLTRKIHPQELFVSHFHGETREWRIDCVVNDWRVSGKNRQECFDKVVRHLLKKPSERRAKSGRPGLGKQGTNVRFTPSIKSYLDELCTVTGLNQSTFLSYLVTKAYSSYQAALKRPPIETEVEDEDCTDDQAFIDAVRRDTFGEETERLRLQDPIQQFVKDRESEMTAIAQRVRADIEAAEAKKKAEAEAKLKALRQAEKIKDRNLKNLDKQQ